MQYLYNLLIYLLQFALWLKSIIDPNFKKWNYLRKQQFRKLGSIKLKAQDRNIIWMHCASLGEFEQGIPVLRSLKKIYPDAFYLLSFFSPSGYEQRKNTTDADAIIYLPLDTPSNAKRIVSTILPSLFIGVKYEYWWNLLQELQINKIKTVYLSVFIEKEKYFLKYNFFKKILQKVDCIFTQDEGSHLLLQRFGFNNSIITMDTRIKSVMERKEKENKLSSNAIIISIKKPVIVYGSIYESDMKVLSSILLNTDYVHLLVPHKVDANNVLKISKHIFANFVKWTQLNTNPIQSNIIIVDSIGYLFDLYRYASVAYVGGGFEKNVHNTLEPAVFGIPVAFGTKNEGFLEIKDFKCLEIGKEVHNTRDVDKFLSISQNLSYKAITKEKSNNYFKAKENQYSIIIENLIKVLGK